MPTHDDTSRQKNKTAGRQARQRRRRDQSREEILEAARSILLKKGIAAMTLEAVAREAGMSKTGLYYYFESKDSLVFELVYAVLERQASAVSEAVADSRNGGKALGAVVSQTVKSFAPNMDDFRLVFMLGQVAASGGVKISAEQLARIRPLNDMALGSVSKMIAEERKQRKKGVAIEPRLLAFLAYLSAIGMLTMKGMVESQGDPLLYSDEQMIDGFAKIFEHAAGR